MDLEAKWTGNGYGGRSLLGDGGTDKYQDDGADVELEEGMLIPKKSSDQSTSATFTFSDLQKAKSQPQFHRN